MLDDAFGGHLLQACRPGAIAGTNNLVPTSIQQLRAAQELLTLDLNPGLTDLASVFIRSRLFDENFVSAIGWTP